MLGKCFQFDECFFEIDGGKPTNYMIPTANLILNLEIFPGRFLGVWMVLSAPCNTKKNHQLKPTRLPPQEKRSPFFCPFFNPCKLHHGVHPGRLTWNLQITHLERKMIFQTSMIMFHVNLQGCRSSMLLGNTSQCRYSAYFRM